MEGHGGPDRMEKLVRVVRCGAAWRGSEREEDWVKPFSPWVVWLWKREVSLWLGRASGLYGWLFWEEAEVLRCRRGLTIKRGTLQMSGRKIDGTQSLRGHEMMEFKALTISFFMCKQKKQNQNKIPYWVPTWAKYRLVPGRKYLLLTLENWQRTGTKIARQCGEATWGCRPQVVC